MRLLNKDVPERAEIELNKRVKIDGGAMTFGKADDYSVVIERVVAASVTATSTANMYAKFLTGMGFEEPGVNDLIIGVDYRGKQVKMLDLLRGASDSVSINNGCYIHTPMNGEGKIKNPSLQPFKDLRFSKVDDVGYTNSLLLNRKFGRKGFKAAESISYPVFNNSQEVVLSQIEKAGGIDSFKGQMYFQFWDNRYLYPLSPFDPVYLDADTEWQMSMFKNRELRNGFALKYILRVGEFENEDNERDFVKTITDMEGADGSRITILQDQYDEETGEIKANGAFRLEKIDTSIDDKLFENWQNALSNSIRKASRMPSILIDYESGALSGTSGEAIKQAAHFYNKMIEDDRALMSRMFAEIFKHHENEQIANVTNWAIKPLDFAIEDDTEIKTE